MKSVNTNAEHSFGKVTWLGPKPSNEARESRLQDLLEFLQLKLAEDGPSEKKLILGNLEDWDDSWPPADAVSTYVGLYFKTPPASPLILAAFENRKITFLWNENSPLENIGEALADLLKTSG